MSERKTYMGRPNFPMEDRAAGDLGREHRLNVKTFSAVVLGDMPAAAWEAASGGMQASAKRYAEKFGSDFIL